MISQHKKAEGSSGRHNSPLTSAGYLNKSGFERGILHRQRSYRCRHVIYALWESKILQSQALTYRVTILQRVSTVKESTWPLISFHYIMHKQRRSNSSQSVSLVFNWKNNSRRKQPLFARMQLRSELSTGRAGQNM